jgi:hypothetical protein
MKRQDLSRLGISELSVPVIAALCLPALCHAVAHVVGVGTREQMRAITARSVVALVARNEGVTVFPRGEEITHPMSKHQPLSRNRELPISAACRGSEPGPALVWPLSINMAPESSNVGLGQYRKWF